MCYPRFHSGFGNSGRYFVYQARVERLRNNIVTTKGEIFTSVYQTYLLRYSFLGKIGDSTYRSEFHFFVDFSSANVQRSAEDIREPEHVVHLVREIIIEFRNRVCHCKYNSVLIHREQHLGGEYISLRKADEYIRTFYRFFESTEIAVGSKFGFLFGEVRSVFTNHTLTVAHYDVLRVGTQSHVQACTRDSGGSCAVYYYLRFGNVLTYNF